jgi:hypothetical protein
VLNVCCVVIARISSLKTQKRRPPGNQGIALSAGLGCGCYAAFRTSNFVMLALPLLSALLIDD